MFNNFDKYEFEETDQYLNENDYCDICNSLIIYVLENRGNGYIERIGYCRECGATYNQK